MDPILVGIAAQLPLVAAFWVALERKWIVTGRHHRDVVDEVRAAHKLQIEELAAVRRATADRERAIAADADERIAYIEARRQEERERARDAERLVAAFAERFGTVATMAERLASLVDGISKRLSDLLDRLDRRSPSDA